MSGAPVMVEAVTSWTAEGPGSAVLLLQVAEAPDQRLVDEQLTVIGAHVEYAPVTSLGARPVRLHAPDGPVSVRYTARATVDDAGRACPADDRPLPSAGELPFALLDWTLPSRYCPSDTLAPTAQALFGEMPRTRALVPAVAGWVRDHIAYTSGASDGQTAADETLLARAGVCRDMAHLAVTFLRALEVPARTVAAYAPLLDPPDFHAVLEAHDGTAWRLIDVTGLAPVTSMVRIATGRDAAEVAWATASGGLTLDDVGVSATGPDG